MKKADIGPIGLAVMDKNLALNIQNNGFTVACYNRTAAKIGVPMPATMAELVLFRRTQIRTDRPGKGRILPHGLE